MSIVQVQFSPWDKVYDFSMSADIKAGVGDFVIVDTEIGRELGKISAFIDKSKPKLELELKSVIRLASLEDAKSVYDEDRRQRAMSLCQDLITRHGLNMKLIDARYSFVGNRLTYAFVSDRRVDFRELVKDLNSSLNLNIRLLQIGSRDEARCEGDCGPCGLELCCRRFINNFSSITSEMAEAQQVVHRGSDRISGMCGRLMCCLKFEYEGYKQMASELPPLGTKIKVEGRVGTVISHHILAKMVDVRFPAEHVGEKSLVVRVDPNKQVKKKEKLSENKFKRFKRK
jgi:cell fate regulator YaaT (PSP1 superfamily)